MKETPTTCSASPRDSKDASAIERSYLLQLNRYRREGGPNPISYLGTQWFVTKVLLAVVAALIFLRDGGGFHAGWLLVGYLIGTVTATLKTIVALKSAWPLQQAIIDWSSVEKRLGANRQS